MLPLLHCMCDWFIYYVRFGLLYLVNVAWTHLCLYACVAARGSDGLAWQGVGEWAVIVATWVIAQRCFLLHVMHCNLVRFGMLFIVFRLRFMFVVAMLSWLSFVVIKTMCLVVKTYNHLYGYKYGHCYGHFYGYCYGFCYATKLNKWKCGFSKHEFLVEWM